MLLRNIVSAACCLLADLDQQQVLQHLATWSTAAHAHFASCCHSTGFEARRSFPYFIYEPEKGL
jgi:hypothetical protein